MFKKLCNGNIIIWQVQWLRISCSCLESCCCVIVIEILLLKFDFKIKPLLAHNISVYYTYIFISTYVCMCLSFFHFFVLHIFWLFASIRMLIVWTSRKCNNVVIYTVHISGCPSFGWNVFKHLQSILVLHNTLTNVSIRSFTTTTTLHSPRSRSSHSTDWMFINNKIF